MAKKSRNKTKAKLQGRFYNVLILAGLLLIALIATNQFPVVTYIQMFMANNAGELAAGSQLIAGSPEKFAFLSGQSEERSVANYCGLATSYVKALPDSAHVQGSCCSAMDMQRYQEQVEGLKAYASLPQVSPDPYDVSVALIKQLLKYDEMIQLTKEEQVIYDQAMQMTDDKGPCCCKCWRWYAYEGQAKYLISELQWSSEQVAALLDLEAGCGGPG